MSTILAIAAGGAIGAMLRHGVNIGMSHWLGRDYPWGTLTVNIAGSFLMGLLISLFAHYWEPPQAVKALLVTGFLGALTTFSTFSLDFALLWEGGRPWAGAGYVLASVLLSLTALFAGMMCIRWISA